MTDKQFRDLKRRIHKLGKKWLITLGFRHWTVRYRWETTPCLTHADCVAKCDVSWEYLDMALVFYCPSLIEKTDEELEEIFVHECCHGLVNEMRMWGPLRMETDKLDEAQKHEERVVSQLTRAFIWSRWDGEQAGRKK